MKRDGSYNREKFLLNPQNIQLSAPYKSLQKVSVGFFYFFEIL